MFLLVNFALIEIELNSPSTRSQQTQIHLSAFCPCTRSDKPQELSSTAVLGAWFCWALKARLGFSHE